MPSPQSLSGPTYEMPGAVVMTNRVIWAALLGGQIATAAVLAFVSRVGRPAHPPLPPWPVLLGIETGLLAFGIVAVVVARVIGFRGTVTDAAIRARYGLRMIVPMAALESSSFAGIIFAFLSGHAWPLGVVPVIAAATQVTLFPQRRVTAG